MKSAPTDFERLGGEAGLRPIIVDFVDRVFSDVMIGFLFVGKPHGRIVEMEYGLAAEQLGADVTYDGRSMAEAHRSSPIMGGHLSRRRKILLDTLRDHAIPDDVIDRWLGHVDGLRDQVLGAGVDPSGCDHDLQATRLGRDRAGE